MPAHTHSPSHAGPLKIVLADDHRMVLSGLRHLLSMRADYAIIAEAQGTEELLSLGELALADVVLLDLNLPVPAGAPASAELPGLKMLPRLRQLTPARIVVLTMHEETAVVLRALQLGASGFVTKSSPSDRLFEAIDTVLAGTAYVDPSILGVTTASAPPPMAGVAERHRDKAGNELSRQEREVGQLLLAGLTQKAISHRLGISPQTTHTYKRRLKEKLDAVNDVELLRKLPVALGLQT